jgi:hypothetical protein
MRFLTHSIFHKIFQPVLKTPYLLLSRMGKEKKYRGIYCLKMGIASATYPLPIQFSPFLYLSAAIYPSPSITINGGDIMKCTRCGRKMKLIKEDDLVREWICLNCDIDGTIDN